MKAKILVLQALSVEYWGECSPSPRGHLGVSDPLLPMVFFTDFSESELPV